MKNIISIILLFVSLLTFTSCFDVVEEVKMKKNGTGELRLTIDLSKSKSNLAGYMNAGEINGVEIPTEEELKKELKKLKKKLSKIDGISKVKTKHDFSNFVFEVQADFKDVKTLNKAINVSIKAFNQTPFPLPKFKHFSSSANQFSRLFKYTDERFTKEEYDGFSGIVQYLMESAKLVSIYRFEKPIKKVSNRNANLSPSKKAVKLEGNIAQFVTGEVSLENHISF